MIKIMKYGQEPNSEIFSRVVPAVNVEAVVADIIANVRENGDKAVLEYNAKFDKAVLDTLQVTDAEIEEKINQICFLKKTSASHLMLTTNDKTVKLWKVCPRCVCPQAAFGPARLTSP